MSNSNDFFNSYTNYKDAADIKKETSGIDNKDINMQKENSGPEAEAQHKLTAGPSQLQEARYVGEKPRPFMALLIASSILGVFILIQLAVGLPFYSELMFDAMNKAGMNRELAEEYYYSLISNAGINTKVLLFSTGASLIAAVLWYYLQYCRKNTFTDLKESCKTIFTGRTIAGFFVGTIALFFLSGIVGNLVMELFPVKAAEYESMLEMGLGDLDSPLVLFIIVVLAPINEECIFRGLILSKLKKNMRPVFAVIITAVLFGVFHMNLIQALYVIPVGAALSYIAWKYQSVIPGIIMHALYNGMNYLVELLPQSLTDSPLFVISIMLAAGIGWYFLEIRRRVERRKADINYHL